MKKLLSIFAVAIISVAIYMLLPDSDELQEGEIVQTNSVEISNSTSYQHDVFYQITFNSLPMVKIKLTKGSGYLEIIEQRADGFIFKTSHLGYSEAEGAFVEWTASGFIDNN